MSDESKIDEAADQMAGDDIALRAEPLTIERLVRTAVQVALTDYAAVPEDERTESARAASEDFAVERTQVLLTPRACLDISQALLLSTPGARGIYIQISVSSPEQVAALGAPVERRLLQDNGSGMKVSYRAQLGDWLTIYHHAPATAEAVVELLPQAPARNAQAGVIVPELLVGLGVVALLGVAAAAVLAGATWVLALLGGVAVTALWLSPLLDLAPRPARPAPRRPLPVAPAPKVGGGRVRRAMPVTLAPLRHRAPRERGHMLGTTLLLSSGLILVGAALCALVAGCGAELPLGYAVRYGGAGAGLSATVEGPLDHEAAEGALRAVAAPMAHCAAYTVRVDSITCRGGGAVMGRTVSFVALSDKTLARYEEAEHAGTLTPRQAAALRSHRGLAGAVATVKAMHDLRIGLEAEDKE